MIYRLPRTVEVNGKEHPIRTDFRDVMTIIYALNDPDLEDKEKVYVLMRILYEDFDDIDSNDYEAAFKAASDFINHGSNSKSESNKKIIDFEQDERLLIPAINRVAGFEVRDADYMHWWTFMGHFMEIGECTYSTVLNIRQKKAKGKKLEKHEQEFYSSNKEMCDIQEKLSVEELEELERLNSWLS